MIVWRSTFCPQTITSQHFSFWQLILRAVTWRLHHRHCHGIISGRRNSYRGLEWFPYRNFWQIGPLGELLLAPKSLHTENIFRGVNLRNVIDYIYIMIRVGFWQNGFFADFYFWAAGFFRGFSRRIFSHFCGKKCPEKSSRKIPGKILQNLHNKTPTHFCRGARPIMKFSRELICVM